jgi:beta-lactam-binding protein with PASTA domain
MNKSIATITIRRTGLQLGDAIGIPYAYAPENTVIAQTPLAHATDVEGPKIGVLTAQPSAPDEAASVMPDLTGEIFSTAALTILHAGFELSPLQNPIAAPTDSSAATPSMLPPLATSGTVIAQIPAAGSRIPAGSTISLTVQQ